MDYEIFSRRDTRCSGESDLPRSKEKQDLKIQLFKPWTIKQGAKCIYCLSLPLDAI